MQVAAKNCKFEPPPCNAPIFFVESMCKIEVNSLAYLHDHETQKYLRDFNKAVADSEVFILKNLQYGKRG